VSADETRNLRAEMVLARRRAGRRPTYVMPTWMVTLGDVAW
jgi:hypothetical protein